MQTEEKTWEDSGTSDWVQEAERNETDRSEFPSSIVGCNGLDKHVGEQMLFFFKGSICVYFF